MQLKDLPKGAYFQFVSKRFPGVWQTGVFKFRDMPLSHQQRVVHFQNLQMDRPVTSLVVEIIII